MRAKELWALVPVPSHVIKKVYSSVTLSKITALYFFFAVLHMLVLGGFQIASHLTNHNAYGVLEAIRSKASVKGRIIPIITPNDDGSGDTLSICGGIPGSNGECVPIFDAPPDNQPQKPKQDQGAATSPLPDPFDALSYAFYAPQTTHASENRILNATPFARIASTSMASGATQATTVATQPVVSAEAPSPASSTAVSPAPFAPAPAPAPSLSLSPSPAPARAPELAPELAPAPSAPAPGPSRADTPPAPAPPNPAQAPPQTPPPRPQAPPPRPQDPPPAPAEPSDTPVVDPLPIPVPLPPRPISALTRLINDQTLSTPPPLSPDASTLPDATPSPAPAPAPSIVDPAQSDLIGLPDVTAILDPVADLATEVSQSSAPPEPTSTDAVGRVKQKIDKKIEKANKKIDKATKKITKAAQRLNDVVGDGDLGDIEEIVGDILGNGNSNATPDIQPIEATPAPAPEVSAPALADEVGRVKQKVDKTAKKIDKATKKFTKAAQRLNDVIGGGDQGGDQEDALIDLPNVLDIVGIDGDILGNGNVNSTPDIQPIETAPAPAPEVSAPALTDEVGGVKQKIDKATKKLTKAAQRLDGVVGDGDQGGDQEDAPIGLLNVGDIVKIDGDILGNGNANATPDIQPIEATPTPAPEVSQSSAPAEPTSTDAVESVEEETTKAATEATEAAQGPSGVVEDGDQGAPIGLLNVGDIVRIDGDILGSGTAEEAPAPPIETTPTPVPEVSQSGAPAEPTSTDAVETVGQETTEATTAAAQEPTSAAEAAIRRLLSRRSLHVEPVFNETGTITAVNITDLTNSGSEEVITIDRTCALALLYPHQEVGFAEKQDFVLVGYYIWLFALAFIAIINESIPHLVAACISSVIAVVWSACQVLRTLDFQKQFDRFITHGACDGIQLLPNFWKQRASIEIPSLVCNCLFMLILGGLAFKLVGRYRKDTSKLVGGEKYVGQLYKVVLVLSIVVQVTMFLIIASLALWVDELFGGAVSNLSTTTNIFKGTATVSLVLALPWFILCWVAVRKENKSLMVAFFVVTTLFIASLCSMFGSDAFRLILPIWPFFRSLTIASLCGLVISLGLSIWCRLRFGRGLASQLAANSKSDDEIMPWDFSNSTEKAWQSFEPTPENNNSVQGQSQPVNGMTTGTTYMGNNAPSV